MQMGVSARLAKQKNSTRADLFWRMAISVLGALLILLALQDFSLFFFGKTAAADVRTRRVGGERDGLGNDKRYSWSVDYTFPAGGRTYEGHTTRLGSATSVAVSRTVYYYPFAPFLNSLEDTVRPNWGQPVTLAAGAFLLVVMNRRKKTKRTSVQSVRNLSDEADAVEILDPVQTAPMASNQRVEGMMNRYCGQCGTVLEAGTRFCPSCGTPASETSGQIAPAARVGWTRHHLDPEVIQRARKNKKNAWIFTLVLTVLFPAGFALAGLFVEDMPMNEALIIGIGLGLLALIIGLVRVSRMKSGTWDGVVTDKGHKQKVEHDRDTTATRYRTVYTLSVREESGKKHTLTYVDNRALYDYFKVGDRIRCHQAFGTYEKYDKSADRVIYCNICGTLNDIAADTCTSCRLPLFK